MPTILDKNQEDAQNAQQNQQEGSIQTTTGSSSQAGGIGGAPKAGPAQGGSFAGREGSRSGTFTNLQNYTRGNVQGGQQTTQRLAGQSQQKAQAAEQARAGEEARVGGQLSNVQQQAQQKQDTARQALTNLSGLGKGQDFASQFQTYEQQLQEGVGTGRETQQGLENIQLQNQQDILAKAQEAQEYGQQLTSETGRQQALKRIAEKPTYSRGQSALDTLLTGTGQNMQTLKQQAQSVQEQDLVNKAQALETNLAQQKASIQSAVDMGLMDPGEAEGLLESIQNQAQTLRTNLINSRDALANQFKEAAQRETLSDPVAAVKEAYGDRVVDTSQGLAVDMGTVNGQKILVPINKFIEGSQLGGNYIDVQSNYISPEQIKLSQVSPEDAIKLNALANLTGLEGEQLSELLAGTDTNTLQELSKLQQLTPEQALSYKGTLGNLEGKLTPDLHENFRRLADPNIVMNLTEAPELIRQRKLIREAINNLYKGGISYEDLVNDLTPLQGASI